MGRRFVQVVAADLRRLAVCVGGGRGEDPLPRCELSGAGVLRRQGLETKGAPVSVPVAGADRQHARVEIDVLDTELRRLKQPQPRAIKAVRLAVPLAEQGADLGSGEHDRTPPVSG